MPEDITYSEQCQPAIMVINDFERIPPIVLCPIRAERVVDVTDLCTSTQMKELIALIKYGHAEDQMYVQLQEQNRRVPISEGSSTMIQTVTPQLPIAMDAQDGVVGLSINNELSRQAELLGFDCLEMAEVIFEYLPQPPEETWPSIQ